MANPRFDISIVNIASGFAASQLISDYALADGTSAKAKLYPADPQHRLQARSAGVQRPTAQGMIDVRQQIAEEIISQTLALLTRAV